MHGKDEVSPYPQMKNGQRTTHVTAPGKLTKEKEIETLQQERKD